MIRALALALVATAAAASALGGPAPFGRLLLAAGLPGLAAPLLSDPAWKGVALYRAGDMDEAARAFRAARAYHNLGNAEAQAGRHAAALEAFDVGRRAGDADSAANFDLVAAYYAGLGLEAGEAVAWFSERDEGPEMDAPTGKGSGRAAGTGSESTNAGALLGLPELESRGRLGVRRVFDDTFMVANERWLQHLADVPGEYLAERIAFERKRREALGLTLPDPEDPR
ncbi:hypothetical protein [Roseivivax isoporae]|uniref:Ca-activated chloride channel family protein n=1 Tax=Roseivivax isoporae LMG 25204 TaxID=1449351 RepID=X7F791_9RHOB|nr:hypothetical protein [Roseivivax isoporae]ETX28665.1 hypothetical protein RISW2_05045 [Roseivivax isoporae LMG 25204]